MDSEQVTKSDTPMISINFADDFLRTDRDTHAMWSNKLKAGVADWLEGFHKSYPLDDHKGSSLYTEMPRRFYVDGDKKFRLAGPPKHLESLGLTFEAKEIGFCSVDVIDRLDAYIPEMHGSITQLPSPKKGQKFTFLQYQEMRGVTTRVIGSQVLMTSGSDAVLTMNRLYTYNVSKSVDPVLPRVGLVGRHLSILRVGPIDESDSYFKKMPTIFVVATAGSDGISYPDPCNDQRSLVRGARTKLKLSIGTFYVCESERNIAFYGKEWKPILSQQRKL